MTVALVLATATARDRAPKPASSEAHAPADARAHARAEPGDRGSAPSTSGGCAPVTGAQAQLAACLPLPTLVGGQVRTQPLLTRLCGQLGALGIRDIVLIVPVGRSDLLTAMALEGLSLPGRGLAAAGNIEAIECASIAAELGAVAAATRRISESSNAVLICAGDLVAHTEALDRLHRSAGTAALTAAGGAAGLVAGPDLRPALRLSSPPLSGPQLAGSRLSGPRLSSPRPGALRLGSARLRGEAGVQRGSRAHGGAWDGADAGVPASGTEVGSGARRVVVAAGSAFHRVHAPDSVGCGAFLVSSGDGDQFAAAAAELAGLAASDLTDDLAAADLATDLATGSYRKLATGAAKQLTPGGDLRARPVPDSPAGEPQNVLAGEPQKLARPAQNGAMTAQNAARAAKDVAGPGRNLTAGSPGNQIARNADADTGAAVTNGRDDPRPAAPYGSGFTDSVALLLVGLVRSGLGVEAVDTCPLVCIRVQTTQQARAAAAELNAVDEDRIHLDAAVRKSDSLFATCFVGPYSRYLVCWAARRGLSPTAVTGMSIGLGSLAAVWFAAGSRAGMILGAALLLTAFVLACVDGQLAQYLRRQTAFCSWLDAAGGRFTEFAVYAGLAAGAAVSRSPSVWALAVATMILQSVRDMIAFCVRPATPHLAGLAVPPRLPLNEPADYAVSAQAGPGQGGASASMRPRSRWPRAQLRRLRHLCRAGLRWLAKIIQFHQGERVAVIAVTVIVAGPRMTFLVLLASGLVAGCLTTIGWMVRSMTAMARSATNLVTYRDDGIIAQSLGRFVDGQLPPLLPAVVGVVVTVVLSAVGVAHLPGLMVFTPVVVMALAGLGSGNPHDGRLDWLVPPLLRLGEYVFLAALALAGHVPMPILFAFIGVIALHQYDMVYLVRRDTACASSRSAPAAVLPPWIAKAGLGWEGRMLAAALGATLGAQVFAFAVLAVYLWVLFGWESLTGWITVAQREYGGRYGLTAVPRATAPPADVEDGGSR